uniref:Putative secreted protein n=1 Tax=Panstrongylus lignarius TaxID=156445 RepID=A0A224XPF5_9HEMI
MTSRLTMLLLCMVLNPPPIGCLDFTHLSAQASSASNICTASGVSNCWYLHPSSLLSNHASSMTSRLTMLLLCMVLNPPPLVAWISHICPLKPAALAIFELLLGYPYSLLSNSYSFSLFKNFP